MQDFDPSLPRFGVRVSAVQDQTSRIREFELVGDGAGLPPFEAGAHIEVAVGEGAIRSYSLANDPRDANRYVIAVLREPDGRGSGWRSPGRAMPFRCGRRRPSTSWWPAASGSHPSAP